MAAHHFVSKFHLRGFCDPSSLSTPDPWLWLGSIANGSVRRRAPHNVGTAPNLFDGPGGFVEPGKTMEKFLAEEVEGPASRALRAVASSGHISELPRELCRYLAWAAARALPVQHLDRKWAERLTGRLDAQPVEPPPEALTRTTDRKRPLRLVHQNLGVITTGVGNDIDSLLDAGWIPDPTERANFLEGAHIQAYYFQVRWFPRLKWFISRPPAERSFILGDRPVGWGVPEDLEAPPSCLRDASAFLIAPLTPTLALVGRNDPSPWQVTVEQVNAILASWSYDWIVGAASEVVEIALRDRQSLCGPPNPPLQPTSGADDPGDSRVH